MAVMEHAALGTPPRTLYLQLDHLDTPRLAKDAAGTIHWRWDSDGYGSAAATEDPDGNGKTTVINLRFPGQYYDQESGLHYNWNRYYSPRLGRYISSDPIGIEGGGNSYTYVEGNPISGTDTLGLFNYVKGAVAVGNVIQAGRNIGTGAASIAGGVGAGATGVGAPVAVGAIALGAWKVNSGISAARRARQQWDEASKECSSDGSWRNLLGLLPYGQHLDDPHENYGQSAAQHALNLPLPERIIFILTYGF